MTKNILKLMTLSVVLMFISCGDEDSQLSLSITGLEDLGSGYAYEGWIMVEGEPKTTGVFNVNSEGNLSQTSFDINADDLEAATAFILTIEPSPDPDPAPSNVHILAGDFSNESANLTVSDSRAIGTDFTDASGSYILATPTDGTPEDETSGVWFLDNSSGTAVSGLSIPTLPEGWVYEGWAVIDGTPVTTGTFTSSEGVDAAAPYSGSAQGPPFPGEDFLTNAPSGLTFPTNLQGATIVISVEPVPDNSPAPFLLKPLVGMTATDAPVHTILPMGNNASTTNPVGMASK